MQHPVIVGIGEILWDLFLTVLDLVGPRRISPAAFRSCHLATPRYLS